MANSTVYPYGTGGSLPSSIGLVNDLKTGGADKALAASQGPEIVNLIGAAALGQEWVMKDIEATWSAGALIARADNPDYNTIVTSDSSWKVTDYLTIDTNYTHLLYYVPQTSNTSGMATRAGIIFYDTNKNPIMGYAGGFGASVVTSTYAIPIPGNAVYIKISSWGQNIWDGVTPNKYAKVSGYAANRGALNKLSELGIVGNSLPLSINSGDNSTVVRNIVGNHVTEYRIGTVAFANRLNIDISGRDISKYYIVRFNYTCSVDVPSNVWVILKDSNNVTHEIIANPDTVPGTTYSQLYLNGARSGEYIGIIPPFREDLALFCIDSQNLIVKARFEISDFSINEIEPTYDFQKGNIPLWTTPVSYIGERINLLNRVSKEKYMSIQRGRQAMCCYGDYAFLHTDKGASIIVYNLRTRQALQTVTMTGASANEKNHGNSACFSNQFYEQGDEFPIMYVSSGYAINGSPKAFGLRIIKTVENDSETFTISLVHTISLDSAHWSEFVCAGDLLYIRYELTSEGTDDSWGVVKTPSVTGGDTTILPTDMFSPVPFADYPHRLLGASTQGYMYHNNRIITVWGQSAPYYFGVVNPETGKVTTLIPFTDLGINEEPESVILWDGHLLINTCAGNLYRLFFD